MDEAFFRKIADINFVHIRDVFLEFIVDHYTPTFSVYVTSLDNENFLQFLLGWLVGCFGFNGPLRQYFSLYRASLIR